MRRPEPRGEPGVEGRWSPPEGPGQTRGTAPIIHAARGDRTSAGLSIDGRPLEEHRQTWERRSSGGSRPMSRHAAPRPPAGYGLPWVDAGGGSILASSPRRHRSGFLRERLNT
jgi:hypothetical protein